MSPMPVYDPSDRLLEATFEEAHQTMREAIAAAVERGALIERAKCVRWLKANGYGESAEHLEHEDHWRKVQR